MAGYRAIFLLLGLLGNSLGGHCSEAQTCEEDDVLSHVQLLKTHGASQRLFCERSGVCIGKEDGPVQSWPDGCTPNDSCKCKSQGLFCTQKTVRVIVDDKEAKEKEQEEQKAQTSVSCDPTEVCIGKEDGPVQSWPDGCTPNDSCKCKSQGLFCTQKTVRVIVDDKEANEKEQKDAAEAASGKDGTENKPKEETDCNVRAELCTGKEDGPVQLPAGCPATTCQCKGEALSCGRISKGSSETKEQKDAAEAASGKDVPENKPKEETDCNVRAELCTGKEDGPVQLPAGCPATPCQCNGGALSCGDITQRSTGDVSISIG